MVNAKTGNRELCYIVKIDEIKPIEGSDNCECAMVGGWHVMVRKNLFHAGDKAVYFEIDSLLPSSNAAFEFLKQKKYRIRTQRYTFGGAGKFYSEGLLMGLEELGVEGEVGDFLTEQLGVTYYEPEDRARKANVDPYRSMMDRHKDLFKKPYIKKLMRYKCGRRLLFAVFGRKKSSSWPSHIMSKTDVERCLIGATKINTDQGIKQISAIVNQKLDVKVASMNPDGTISYKKILDYQKFNNKEEMITIGYSYKVGVTRLNHLCCTPDHKLFTQRGWVKAKDLLLTDFLYKPEECFDEEALGTLYGTLLGDGHISNDTRSDGRLRAYSSNGEKQLNYLKYKQELFNGVGKIVASGTNNYSGLNGYHWYLPADGFISESLYEDFYIDGKKTVTEKVVNKLTDAGLALWYMDDGNLSYRDGKIQRPSIRINTQGFSYEENQILVNYLNSRGIECHTTEENRTDKPRYWHIYITVNGTPKFLNIVTPYMCQSMAYKTIPELEYLIETKKPLYVPKMRVLKTPVVSIEQGQKKNQSLPQHPGIVYDLEVEDNHNFIADGIVVHNCQNMLYVLDDKHPYVATEKVDGTSCSVAIERKGVFRKFKYYVCSRNVVFDKPNKECFYDTNVYLEAFEKYNLKEVITKMYKDLHVKTLALQMEVYGDGIQKRDYSLASGEHRIAVFHIWMNGAKVQMDEVARLCEQYGIPHVPIIDANHILPDTIEELQEYVESAPSLIDGKPKEGIVFYDKETGQRYFKFVSPEFLMQYH